MNPDPFASIPNADDSENGEFSPAKTTTPSRPRGLDIIERTGQAEYYLREARRAGLPLPAYVTVSSHRHGSHIGIQLTSTDSVGLWAQHFGVQPVISGGGVSAELGDTANHEVSAYYMFPEPDRKPVPPQPPMTDTMSGSYVPGLAEHTQAAPAKALGDYCGKCFDPECDGSHQFVPGLDTHTQAAVGDRVRNRFTGAIGTVTKASTDFLTVKCDADEEAFSGQRSAFEPFVPGLDAHTQAAPIKCGDKVTGPRGSGTVVSTAQFNNASTVRYDDPRAFVIEPNTSLALAEHTQAACDTITKASQ